MRHRTIFRLSFAARAVGMALLGLLAVAGAAPAQTAPAKPAAAPPERNDAPPPAEPGATSASYGDWVLRCQRLGETGKTTRLCEVTEVIQVQGQSAPLAQIAIGRPAPGEPLRVTAVFPVAVSFPSTARVGHAKEGTALDLEWRRCLPGGCFADARIKDDVLKRWRGLTDAGVLAFKDAAGRDVAVPLSFRGLAQALDALGKEGF